MTKRMLIDASHAEETRVVVLDGNRLEDFDVETSTKKQLKGNIYLAKVVRVEPSLQAAFVEYGGGRHGFLAFSEIHPDYYQIPVADRQRLLEMQAAEEGEDDEEEDEDEDVPGGAEASVPEDAALQESAPDEGTAEGAAPEVSAPAAQVREASEAPAAVEIPIVVAPPPPLADAPQPGSEPPAVESPELSPEATPSDTIADAAPAGEADPEPGKPPRAQPAEIPEEVKYGDPAAEAVPDFPPETGGAGGAETGAAETGDDSAPEASAGEEDADFDAPEPDAPPPETINGESDTGEEVRARRTARFLRNYRIQEVIKRRQILLVQVVKEERGTKGAALTTYISLAGRFCVLMPNSPRGGGISRKITSAADRKRLREITTEMQIPRGMGLIVRTAGANRPKAEIRRDCEYLMRLWDDIREHTMHSMAPALIYEEASLIKRAIRDVYSRDIDEIVVDGEEGWKAAHDFMRMLMPSHARKVQLWRPQDVNGQSLFGHYQVEAQLDAMLLPNVQLKSGGYLVINQAEALVAIDVNSGRATRERGIEETALRTNLEASDEVARQLRLRDLAGLIVIDFIDMEAKKNNAAVERRLKEALRGDRARIQVGHISHFGLMEMSRQRLRPSLAETSFMICPHCQGLGQVRTIESSALHILRDIEDEGAKGRASLIQLTAASSVILYILNHKREQLALIEQRSGMHVTFITDETLVPPQIRLERLRAMTEADRPAPVTPDVPTAMDSPEAEILPTELEEALEEALAEAGAVQAREGAVVEEDTGREETAESRESEAADGGEEGGHRRRRRRRRRGGRDGLASGGEAAEEAEAVAGEQPAIPPGAFPSVPEPVPPQPEAEDSAPEAVAPVSESVKEPTGEPAAELVAEEDEEATRRRRGRRGGRRRRREVPAAEEMPVVPEAVEVAVWNGPTPADPFGQTFDIFDLMDQQEQARVRVPAVPDSSAEAIPADVAPVAEKSIAKKSIVEDTVVPEVPIPEMPVIESGKAPVRVVALPEESVISVAVLSATPESAPAELPVAAAPEAPAAEALAPVEPTAEESAEPVAGPAIKPVVLGKDPLPGAQRKRGWWRR